MSSLETRCARQWLAAWNPVGPGRLLGRGGRRRTGRNSVLATTTYFEGRKAFAAGVAYEDCPLEDELGRVAWQRGWLEAQRETESDERI